MSTSAKGKKRHLFWLKIFLSIILIAILLGLIVQPSFGKALATGLIRLPWYFVVFIFILFTVMRGFQTLVLQHALFALGTRVRLGDCAQLLGLKGLYNMGFMGGGVAAQIAQANISLEIKIGHFMLATFLQAAIFASSLLLLFGLVLVGFRSEPFPHNVIIGVVSIASALMLVTVVISRLGPNGRIISNRALAFIPHLKPEIKDYQALRSQIAYVYIYSLGLHIARSLRFICIMFFMASQVPLSFSMTAVLGADIVGQIPITPAGIGTRELALGYFGKVLSLFDIFLAAAIIDRTAAICFNLGHGLLSFFTLSFFSDSSPQ